MFRVISLLLILIGFKLGQLGLSSSLGEPHHAVVTAQGASSADSTDHSTVPNDTNSDEDSPDVPHFDGDPCLLQQNKFHFVLSQGRASLKDHHFNLWVLVSDLERPPKSIA